MTTVNGDHERLIRIEERLGMLTDISAQNTTKLLADVHAIRQRLEAFVTRDECTLRQAARAESSTARAVNLSKVVTLLVLSASIVTILLRLQV